MLKTIVKKWWMILLQGILLIVLGIYAMRNPGATLLGISFWVGLLVFGTGIAGIIGYFAADKEEKENLSIGWSIVSAIIGFLMLGNMLATMKTVTVIFGLWMLATGFLLTKLGWDVKNRHSFGWILVVTGVLSIIAGVMMLFDMGTAAVGISTLLGLQAIVAGIGFIILSLAKKNMVGRVEDKVEQFRAKVQ
jgi:uncharacterized membrane protein HdeD (DUF308 family)